MASVGIGLLCLYESPLFPDHRRAPLRASGTFCTTPPPIARFGLLLSHPCRFHPFGCANLAYQGHRIEETRLLSFPVMVLLYPCYPQMRVLLLFFFRPTAAHGRPLFKVPCPDAMLLDPIRAVLCIFRQASDLLASKPSPLNMTCPCCCGS